MDGVYQYMNQEKLNLYDEKTLKKNIGTQKTYYINLAGGGGEGVSQIHEKKIVSVGLFSTFCHPLAALDLSRGCTLCYKVCHSNFRLNLKWCM